MEATFYDLPRVVSILTIAQNKMHQPAPSGAFYQ
jgi:hypothetical protein